MPAPRPIFSISVDQTALTANTARTLVEVMTVAATGIIPVEWWVEFDGVTASATPVLVEVGIFSAQTTTGTATTPNLWSGGERMIGSACTCRTLITSEGSGTPSIVDRHRIPPTSGLLYQVPLGLELAVGATQSFRIRATAAAACNATSGIKWSE